MSNPLWLQNFIDVYSKLNTENLNLLSEIYHPNVQFKDPMHEVNGISDLLAYFDKLYSNLTSCNFVISHSLHSENEAAIYWSMTFCHRQLNNKQPVTVQGHSQLKAQDNKVIYHRDYLDVGSMLYEHIPLLGKIITMIKNRVGNA